MIDTSGARLRRRFTPIDRVAGFTLPELMIVLVIVGSLVAFGLPSYLDSIQRTKRTDAYAALASVADAQELVFNNQAAPRSYTDSLADLGLPTTSPDGYYDVLVTACADGTLADCYEVRATAREDGPQWKDEDCRWLSIDSRGRRSSGPDASRCWRK